MWRMLARVRVAGLARALRGAQTLGPVPWLGARFRVRAAACLCPGPHVGRPFALPSARGRCLCPDEGLSAASASDPIPKYASAFSFGSAALMGARGFSSFLRSRSVFRLKQEADGNPGDVEKLLSLYECWGGPGDTNKIISRYQSGNYAYDDRVVEIYAEAYESVHGQMPRGVEDRIGGATTRPQMGRGTYQGSSQYDYAAGARGVARL